MGSASVGIRRGWFRAIRRSLVPGMVLCVERSVEKHGFIGDFEETVVVTESGE